MRRGHVLQHDDGRFTAKCLSKRCGAACTKNKARGVSAPSTAGFYVPLFPGHVSIRSPRVSIITDINSAFAGKRRSNIRASDHLAAAFMRCSQSTINLSTIIQILPSDTSTPELPASCMAGR